MCDDKNLGASSEWGQGAYLKTPTFIAFSNYVNTLNLNGFLTYGEIYKFERRFNKGTEERVKAVRNLEKYERIYH